jgi:hypothetical protein
MKVREHGREGDSAAPPPTVTPITASSPGPLPAAPRHRLTGWELVAALVVIAAAEIAALAISGTAAVPIIAVPLLIVLGVVTITRS